MQQAWRLLLVIFEPIAGAKLRRYVRGRSTHHALDESFFYFSDAASIEFDLDHECRGYGPRMSADHFAISHPPA
jgi:hypothetical protein